MALDNSMAIQFSLPLDLDSGERTVADVDSYPVSLLPFSFILLDAAEHQLAQGSARLASSKPIALPAPPIVQPLIFSLQNPLKRLFALFNPRSTQETKSFSRPANKAYLP